MREAIWRGAIVTHGVGECHLYGRTVVAQFEILFSVDFSSPNPYSPRMKKRPRDVNQLGKLMVDIATGDVQDAEETPSEAPEDEAEKPAPLPRLWLTRSEIMGSETETTSDTTM